MNDTQQTRSDELKNQLFAACEHHAARLGGSAETVCYFFARAQRSRVERLPDGAFVIADMDMQDWCDAVARHAPGNISGPAMPYRSPRRGAAARRRLA